MDVNEALMDLEFEPNTEKLLQVNNDVNSIEKQLNDELSELVKKFDENPSESDQILYLIKDIFYRQKYISRLRERLSKQ